MIPIPGPAIRVVSPYEKRSGCNARWENRDSIPIAAIQGDGCSVPLAGSAAQEEQCRIANPNLKFRKLTEEVNFGCGHKTEVGTHDYSLWLAGTNNAAADLLSRAVISRQGIVRRVVTAIPDGVENTNR